MTELFLSPAAAERDARIRAEREAEREAYQRMRAQCMLSREGRLAWFFREAADWVPFEEWPPVVRTMQLLEHKQRDERFRLMVFFCGNGVDPAMAVDWIRMKDYNHDTMQPVYDGSYDRAALNDFKSLAAEATRPAKLMDGTVTKELYKLAGGAPVMFYNVHLKKWA